MGPPALKFPLFDDRIDDSVVANDDDNSNNNDHDG